MTDSRIETALRQAGDTEVFEAGSAILPKIPGLFRRFFDPPAVVVADEITFEAAGRSVDTTMREAGLSCLAPYIFPGTPVLHCDYRHICALRDFIEENHAIPVAVGSGTVNDIVKRAAFEAGRRYMVVATAASVDGYSSYGASVTRDGFKKTMEGMAPQIIVADSEVLRTAPPEMTAAGYADLASKITAGADWIIADAIGVDPIDPPVWDMVQADLQNWLASPGKLSAGDGAALKFLFEGLTMTGFAMQALRKSRPASGCDHLFSHVWEMQNLRHEGQPVSHGFTVGIGTLASTALMEIVFRNDPPRIDIERRVASYPSWEDREQEVRESVGETPLLARILQECAAKHLTGNQLGDRLELILDVWPDMRERVLDQLVPYRELKEMFLEAQCPVLPGQIGLTPGRVAETVVLAQQIRNRYTILDLIYEIGAMPECREALRTSSLYLR